MKEEKKKKDLGKGGDLLPLVGGGIHTCGVVGASVEQNHGLLGGSLVMHETKKLF